MKWTGAVVASVMMAGAIAPSRAEACLRMERRRVQTVDRKLQDVKKAEHLLALGEGGKAVKVAKRRFKKFTAATGEPDSGGALFNRAQRTIALATMRADGALDLGRGMRGKSASEQADNLAWATSVLEIQAASDPDNLLLRTFYAEALLHHPGGDLQAVQILGEMANDDLMPTARGFALLATAQQKLGDVSGHDLSVQRCLDLGEGEDVCKVA